MEWTEWNTNDRARKEKKREEKEKKEGRKERKSTSRLEIAALGESVDLDVLFAFCEIRFLGKGERERDKLASGWTLGFICLFVRSFVCLFNRGRWPIGARDNWMTEILYWIGKEEMYEYVLIL